MTTTITVDGYDDLTAFVGLSPDMLHDALYLRTYQLDLLWHIIGVAQMRLSAPRRKMNEPARDETVVLPMSWLKSITHKGHTKTKDRVLQLAGLRLGGRSPLKVYYVMGAFQITVARDFAYPPHFIRIPLPLPVGDRDLVRAWLKLWTALHHGRRQPIPLDKPLGDDQLAQLNQHLRKLDNNWRLPKHGITVPTRVGQTVSEGVHCLVPTMPKQHGD